MATIDNPQGTYVNSNRLTNCSGWDGALTMSMILSCFVILHSMFQRSSFILGSSSSGVAGGRDEFLDMLHKVQSMMGEYNWELNLNSTEGWNNFASWLYVFGENDTFNSLTRLSSINPSDNNRMGFNEHAIVNSNVNSQLNASAHMSYMGMNASDFYTEGNNLSSGLNADSINGGDHSMSEEEISQAATVATANRAVFSAMAKVAGYGSSSAFYDTGENRMGLFTKGWMKKMSEDFARELHGIMYEGGFGFIQDQGRQAILAILEAAKDGNYDVLYTDPNTPNEFTVVQQYSTEFKVRKNTSIAKYDPTITPKSLMETIDRMAMFDAAPMRLFTVCKSMVDYLYDSTTDLSQKASVLRNASIQESERVAAPSEESKALSLVLNTQNGKDLVSMSSYRQLKLVHQRLDALAAASEDTAFQADMIDSSVFRALKIFLDDKQSVRRSAIVYTGMPSGKLEAVLNGKSGDPGFANNSNVEYKYADSALNMDFRLNDELLRGLKFKPINVVYPLDVSISIAGIQKAFESETPPQSMQELVRQVHYNIDKLTYTPTAPDLNLKSGLLLAVTGYKPKHLQNVLESFLLKKLAKILGNHNLEEEDFILSLNEARRSSARTSMALAASALSIPSGSVVVDSMFGKSGDMKDPNFLSAINLLDVGVGKEKEVKLNTAEFQALLSVFNSKPFFEGNVDESLFRPCLFDYVFATFIDLDNFELDELSSENAINALSDELQLTGEPLSLFKDKFIYHDSKTSSKNSIHIKSIYTNAAVVKRPTS